MERLCPLILPEYLLVYVVPILANQMFFKDTKDKTQLSNIEKCLKFILEPLMKSEYFSYSFYMSLIEEMKRHDDALRADNTQVSHKWYFNFFFLPCTVVVA